MPSIRGIALVLAGLAGMAGNAAEAHSQNAPADSSGAVRGAFDFLIGHWEVVSRQDSAGTVESRGETYTFERSLGGVLLTSRWHFNRGTRDRPDFVDAAYYSAYDTRARIWTFYYVSPQSAQYWPGHFEDGHWYFTNTFVVDGVSRLQRQWWESVDPRTVRRHIENSTDGGKTWVPLVITLRRR